MSFNHFSLTEECLHSVLATNYPNLSIILVDNGSTDNTPEKVRNRFVGIKIIEIGQNLGVPAGYNVGFKYALEQGADYILMLNNDTTISVNFINKLIETAERDPKTGIVMPKVVYQGKEEKVWSSGGRYRRFPPAILMTDNRKGMQEKTRLIEFAPACGLLIHRRAFERAGLFDPGFFFFFEDWDFSERVRANGLNIWYTPSTLLIHKGSSTTLGPQSRLYWRVYGESIVRFYKRHGSPVWLSLPIHLGYIILREIFWKWNWKYWPDFIQGVKEGFRKPLGRIPNTIN